MQKKLQEGVPINEVKVGMPATVMKNLSANLSANGMKSRSELAVNEFQKAGISSTINSVID